PYLEGESLRDRLSREKQLPIEDAVQLTTEVAAALAYAHSRGVIHRDIKPENILLTGGAAVVADFGIARAVTAAGGGRLTETGLSLGTPQYMSPEQATAERELDGRSDIYSLGCVLYEMLAGEPPHTGPTTQAVIAKVLTDEPRRLRLTRSTVPPHIEFAVHKALAKLPADRFGTATLFTEGLTKAGSGALSLPMAESVGLGQEAGRRSPRTTAIRRLSPATPWAVAAVAVLMAGWMAFKPRPEPPVVRLTLRLPRDAPLANSVGENLAVSPDGSRIAYVARVGDRTQLYVRPLDQLGAVPIPGTMDGITPDFSPDGRWILYQDGKRLARVPLAGGPVRTVHAGLSLYYGFSWAADDSIIFSSGSALLIVSASGGVARLVASADSSRNENFRGPEFLPDGRAALFTIRTPGDVDRSALVVRRTGEVKRFDQSGNVAGYVEPGYVVLATTAGTVAAFPFDLRRLAFRGAEVPVVEGVDLSPGGTPSRVAVSREGLLVYATGVGRPELVQVTRGGVVRDLAVDALSVSGPRLSPDGRSVLVQMRLAERVGTWLYGLADRSVTLVAQGDQQIWARDGRRITYRVWNGGEGSFLNLVAADGNSPPESLLAAPRIAPGDFTPDGGTLVYASTVDGKSSLWYARQDSGSVPTQLVRNAFNNRAPSLSPDGRWVAYVSDESGREEVYVRAFPGPGARWQISMDGGTEPKWSGSGREIFYRSGPKMMAAAVQTQPTVAVGERSVLFQGDYAAGLDFRQYDVTRDGNSFIMVKHSEGAEVVVVLNWFERLRRSGSR
ncbi:MAG: serine/threonine-protein kinase, partial [Gemmatimonadetes bacterium]|nr:serine/threonine-protein kinase [Gemmatimonadota bacterium]